MSGGRVCSGTPSMSTGIAWMSAASSRVRWAIATNCASAAVIPIGLIWPPPPTTAVVSDSVPS